MNVEPNDEGLKHWLQKLKEGVSRAAIYDFFKQVAQQENAKAGHQPQGAPTDLTSLLDNREGRKRGLIIMKESIGDIALATALFEDFHVQNPNTDLYVAVDPKYSEVLAGNEFVHKVLPYIPAMENELVMIGQGTGPRLFDVYYHPAIPTQRLLNYLSQPEPAFDIRFRRGAFVGSPPPWGFELDENGKIKSALSHD